jgi:hypothetical protein
MADPILAARHGEPFTLLYVSDVAGDAHGEWVLEMARESRRRNEAEGITGRLASDDVSFAQYVEGPRAAILDLLDRLRRDGRHTDVEVLVLGPVGPVRRFAAWHFGVLLAPLPGFEVRTLRGLRGSAAIERFEAVVPPVQ